MVDQLIDFGAERSLSTLAAMGDDEGVRHFLDQSPEAARTLAAGADPNADYDSSGCCLDIVCHKHPNECDAMAALLKRHGGRTPIWGMDAAAMKAAMASDPELLKDPYFLQLMLHADEDLVDEAFAVNPAFLDVLGTLPKDAAAMKTLLKNGLHPDAGDWLGTTLLHQAAERNDVGIVKTLLAAGADIDAGDFRSGGTPLATAARFGHEETAAFLLDAGADPNVADGPWGLPISRAESAEHPGITALLEKHGAVPI